MEESHMDNMQLWQRAAEDIFWYRAPTELLDSNNQPFYRWYPDGVTNACYNALDIHVEQGRGEQARAGQRSAAQRSAGQRKAGQRRAEQSRAGQA